MSSCYVLIDTANLKDAQIQVLEDPVWIEYKYKREVIYQRKYIDLFKNKVTDNIFNYMSFFQSFYLDLYNQNTAVMYDYNVPWFTSISM